MTQLLKLEKPKVTVLSEHSTYEEALAAERAEHEFRNVVKNPEYLNASIATENAFSNPAYATYRHVESGKTVRLKRTDEDVENGTFVGVTKGTKSSFETRAKISEASKGEANGFFGRTHSTETKEKLKAVKTGTKASKKTKELMSAAHRGVPKADAHREKLAMRLKKNAKTKVVCRSCGFETSIAGKGGRSQKCNREKRTCEWST